MLQSLRLKQYTNDEIRKLAVVKVTHQGTQDRGIPKLEGVTDPRLGLVDHTIRCPTCHQGSCNQHLGQIELARPVQRLGTIGLVLMLLRCVCRQCAKPKFKIPNDNSQVYPTECIEIPESISKMRFGKEKLRAISECCRSKYLCAWCKTPQPNQVRRERTFLDASYRPKELSSASPEFTSFARERFMPDEAYAILASMDLATIQQLGFEVSRPEDLLLTLQIVPPPSIRPSNFVGESKVRSENDLTIALQDIVRSNIELENLWSEMPENVRKAEVSIHDKVSKSKIHDFFQAWDKLQVMTSGLVNHTIKKTIATRMGLLPVVTSTNKRKVIDIKTRLCGKKGRLRGNLSGKRVDQSGRSVISPDASHDIYELGVPECIMNKLTFPETVASWNLDALAKCVVRGAFVENGALAVRPPGCDSEHVIWLPVLDLEARTDLAASLQVGYIVERHLQDGDFVLFNRQPSLWKASLMAFQAYRVKGLTFRLPLPVTRPFNADFDGDEMNIHALQTQSAMAEAQEIMAAPHQIVSPQSNAVLIGLVQDSLVAGYLLSSLNTLFTEEQFFQILCQVHHDAKGPVEKYREMTTPARKKVLSFLSDLPMPAILKPKKMWTGKQVVSCLLSHDISFTKCVRNASNDTAGILSDNVIHVQDGHLLTGRLSKEVLGTSSGGFVQAVWKQHGPWAAAKFVSDAQRVFVNQLNQDTVCISIRDAVQSPKTQEDVSQIIQEQYQKAQNILYLQVPPEVQEVRGSSVLQETLRRVGAKVLENMDTESGLNIVVTSGSKGNLMNIAQIAGCVGQQTVYGRRVPPRKTPNGFRTLATFAPNDMRPASRGFVSSSYLKGLSPTEFFQHQMAGREGIVATAVSTADTGYNQRRMIKGQESQCILYDGTVRVGNNNIVQFIQGGDDMDGSKLLRKSQESLLKESCFDRVSPDLLAFAKNVRLQILKAIHTRAQGLRIVDAMFSVPYIYAGHRQTDSEKPSFDDLKALEVALVKYHSSLHALPKLQNKRPLVTALTLAHCIFDQVPKNEYPKILEKYAEAMIMPGEGVGAVGSSSIGEPSMQLTLNVFHFSGIASKNVTISGLPRFKELINAADTSITANMNGKVCDHHSVDQVMSQVQQVYLRNVVEALVERTHVWPQWVRMLLPWKFFENTTIGGKKRNRDGEMTVVRPTRSMPIWGIKMKLKWFACRVNRTHMSSIVESLRNEMGSSWSIIADPHWSRENVSSSGPFIYIVLNPQDLTEKQIKSTTDRQLEMLLKDHAIQGIWNVKRAISVQDPYTQIVGQNMFVGERLSVDTEGSSLLDFANTPGIASETVRTTNILETATVLGISAAVASLQAELHKTVSFDSAQIDMRHTWLLADSMCRMGRVSAMNRHNMEDLGASLLQRASFEQSLDVFEEGASFGKSDSLSGATERIMVGQPVAIGTGMVHCITEKSYASLLQTEEVRGRVVKPFQNKDPMMIRKKTQTLVGPNFMSRFQDQDKVCEDPFFLGSVQNLRTTAASERLIPDLIVESLIDISTFNCLRKEAKDFSNWTQVEALCQRLIVRYEDSSQTDVLLVGQREANFFETTVIQTSLGMPKMHRRVVVFKSVSDNVEDADPSLKSWIRKTFPVTNQELPSSVEPIQACVEQFEKFLKNGIQLEIIRRFEGSNAVEIEKSMSTTSPTQVAKLSFENPEAVLQERVTDDQIANALMDRLPVC